MTSPETPSGSSPNHQAAEHVAAAQQLLRSLQQRLGEHPELEQAIRKLELALSALTLQTGGLL